MGRLVALFGMTLALVSAGGYLNRNPEAVQHLRGLMPAPPGLQPRSRTINETGWKVYTPPNNEYRLEYPENWNLSETVPGCGPVWFAPITKKIWFTVCKYDNETSPLAAAQKFLGEGAVLENRETRLIGGESVIVQAVKLPGGTGKQVFFPGGLSVSLTRMTDEYQEAEQIFEKIIASIKLN